MTRLRRRKRMTSKAFGNDAENPFISDFHEKKILSKKELELQMQQLRLEIKLNEQIRKLINRELDKFLK